MELGRQRRGEQIAEYAAKRFDRRVAGMLVDAFQPTFDGEPLKSLKHITTEFLNREELLPFQVYPMAITASGSLFRSAPKRCTEFTNSLWRYLHGGEDAAVVIRIEDDIVALHNLPQFSASGCRVHFPQEKTQHFYIDDLESLIAAVVVAQHGRASRPASLATDVGSAERRSPKPQVCTPAISRRFARISADVLKVVRKMNRTDWLLYVTLCTRADYRTRRLCIGQRKLAKLCGFTQPRVCRSIKCLCELGLVRVIRKGALSRGSVLHLPLPAQDQKIRFIDVPEWVLEKGRDFGRRGWAVYTGLSRLISFKERKGTVGQARIADLSGVDLSRIPSTVRALEKSGAVIATRKKRGTKLQYQLPKERPADRGHAGQVEGGADKALMPAEGAVPAGAQIDIFGILDSQPEGTLCVSVQEA